MKASDLSVKCLEADGIEYIFGVSGEEKVDFVLSPRNSSRIKFVPARHEQGAAFMPKVFSRNIDSAPRVYRRIDASAMMINDHIAFRVYGMPFAGLRESGLGVGGIPHTIADMQVEKVLVLKPNELGQ